MKAFNYSQHVSKFGRQDASTSRRPSIVNRSIQILTDLRSAVRGSFHASCRPNFKTRWVCVCVAILFSASSCVTPHKKTSIAILTPITHPSLERIEEGFKETIEAEHPGQYRFVTYNAQGNKTLMRGEIEEIAEKGYPLVFTIGTLASQMTTEVFTKKNMNTPIVFTSVNDPVGCHIVRSEQTPGGHVTGIKELLDFQKELELALSFKPNIHRILLVWNPMEPSLAKDVQEIDAHLSKKGIKLLTVEIFQTNECMAKVSPLVAKSDAMLVLKDNIVVSGLDTLIKLCNLHRIPLIASDLDSPDRGAALGVGVREVDFGIEGAKKALQILDQRVPAGDIPVTPVSPITYKINREAAISQGIEAAFLNIEAPSDLLRN